MYHYVECEDLCQKKHVKVIKIVIFFSLRSICINTVSFVIEQNFMLCKIIINFSLISTNWLCLQHAQIPRMQDLAIFVPTTMTTDKLITLPLAHARRVKMMSIGWFRTMYLHDYEACHHRIYCFGSS